MTINELRQYRKTKGRKLLLEAELEECENGKETARLKSQISFLQQEMQKVEEYIDSIGDPYIEDMIKAHYIRGRSWTSIAWQMGGGNTNESVRKQCHRYIKNH